jgi:nucleotide-binding universal stress UspA family protein
MDYKSIVVFLDSSRRSDARMDFAVDLALRHGAHLSGVYVEFSTLFPAGPDPAAGMLLAKLDEYLAVERSRTERRFAEAARRAGLAYDWSFLRGPDARLAPVRARTCDLAIVGQTDPDDPESKFAAGFPETVVMGAGRPVLFAPYTGPLATDFRRVLVAWDGSREAARAVADALPLLVRATSVAVVSVEAMSDPRETLPRLDVGGYLSRNGVKAEIQVIPGVEISVGEWLLSQAASVSADLMVTGAYGHARMREWILGGVTRTLLRSMPLPVLMSH